MVNAKLSSGFFSSLICRSYGRDEFNWHSTSECSYLPAIVGKANDNQYSIEVAPPLSHPLPAFSGMLYTQVKPVLTMSIKFYTS